MNLQKKTTAFRGFYRTAFDHLIYLDYSADAADIAEWEVGDVFYN